MRTFFYVVLTMMIATACSEITSATPEENIYSWGSQTVEELSTIYPQSFKELSADVLAPIHEKDMQVSLSEADLRFLRNAGIISSVAEFCKMEWAEKHYLPMMQWQRVDLPSAEKNGRKIAMIGALHGVFQEQGFKWISENDAKCEQARRVLKGNLFADKF